MFSQKGEKCSEPTRFLIQRGLYEGFVARLAAMAEAVVCGDPFDPKSDQGAQCNAPQLEKILSYLDVARRDGARLRAGGERDLRGTNARGLFVRPTIFDEVRPDMRIAREEIFGPVLCVLPFDDEDEAVRLANDGDFGLAAGLYTRDVSRAHRVARRLDAGMVFVNRYGCYDFASPFGGFKQSGWGKEMALHSLDAYTRTKSVWIAL
jgi:aldehyde dehydrogenase (NAD+)